MAVTNFIELNFGDGNVATIVPKSREYIGFGVGIGPHEVGSGFSNDDIANIHTQVKMTFSKVESVDVLLKALLLIKERFVKGAEDAVEKRF